MPDVFGVCLCVHSKCYVVRLHMFLSEHESPFCPRRRLPPFLFPHFSHCPTLHYLTFSTSDPFSLRLFPLPPPCFFPLIFKHFEYYIFKIHFIPFFLGKKKKIVFCCARTSPPHFPPFNCRHLTLIISPLLPPPLFLLPLLVSRHRFVPVLGGAGHVEPAGS